MAEDLATVTSPNTLSDDSLSAEDRAALGATAAVLWDQCASIAAEWSAEVVAAMPEYFPAGGPAAVEQLTSLNHAFLAFILDRMRAGDFEGLAQAYYEMNRRLVEADIHSATPQRISLASLYASALHGFRAIESRLAEAPAAQRIAVGKLRAHLLVLVGLAYSDAREEALRRGRDELERVVEERTAALAKEKELAESIIESLPGIFYMFDEQGHFLRWNRNFEVVSKCSGEEVGRMHPVEFFRGDDQHHVAERIGEAFRAGESTAEADFVAKDETRAPYFFTGHRVVVDGQITLIGMGIDVTARRQAEEALGRARREQLFGALLEAAPDAVVVSDRSGTIVFANSETERMFGWERAQLVGRSVGVLIPDELRERPRRSSPGPLSATVEAEGRRRDGARFPVEIKLSPFETEDGPLLTSAIRDITERKQAEAEILHLNIDLEHRVEERTRELARSNADLEQFAYVASHDLQEPLRAVASYTQLLARRYQQRLDGDAIRFIERTVAAVGRMQALIRDLLAYSRVGTRGEPFGPTDCEDVLRDVLEDLQAAVAETGAIITHDPLPLIAADSSQLRQLFQNLIGNAIKFRRDEPPRVHLSCRRNAESWSFAVQDNGIGIEPEYADRVFVIFQRLHGRRRYPGTGVGLSICKKIVERHGGRIWVEPSVGHGARICFELPAEAIEEAAGAAAG